MTMNDHELRIRFDELRDAERRRTPPFRLGAPVRPRVLWPRFAVAAALLLIVIAAIVQYRRRDVFTPADQLAARTIAAWSAPTDSLLRTPGRELLSDLPHIPSAELSKGVLQ